MSAIVGGSKQSFSQASSQNPEGSPSWKNFEKVTFTFVSIGTHWHSAGSGFLHIRLTDNQYAVEQPSDGHFGFGSGSHR
jgi:hypothetical protein